MLVHVFRTRRPIYWAFIIFFTPLLGSLIYFIVELLPEIMGNPKTKKDTDNFNYLSEDELYTMKLKKLKEHVNTMISRDKGTFKYALTQFNKQGLIDLILGCQGIPAKQKGGGREYVKRGSGWGFMF